MRVVGKEAKDGAIGRLISNPTTRITNPSLPIAPSLAFLPPPKSESKNMSSLVGILSHFRVQLCV